MTTVFIGPRRTGTSALHTAFASAGYLRNRYVKERFGFQTPLDDIKKFLVATKEDYIFEPSLFGREDVVSWLVDNEFDIVIIRRDEMQRLRSDFTYHKNKGMDYDLVKRLVQDQFPSFPKIEKYLALGGNIRVLDYGSISDVDYLNSALGVELSDVPIVNRTINYPLFAKKIRPIYRLLPYRVRLYIRRIYEKRI